MVFKGGMAAGKKIAGKKGKRGKFHLKRGKIPYGHRKCSKFIIYTPASLIYIWVIVLLRPHVEFVLLHLKIAVTNFLKLFGEKKL